MRRISLILVALAAVGWGLISLAASSPDEASAGTIEPAAEPSEAVSQSSALGTQEVGQSPGAALAVEEDSSELLDAGPASLDCLAPVACDTHYLGAFDPPLEILHFSGSLVSLHVRLQI